MDRNLARIESKLDALLAKSGIKPEDVKVATAPAAVPVPLTAAEQEAIDRAPKPTPAQGPVGTGPRRVDPVTNAPIVATPVPTGNPERQLEAETGHDVVQTGSNPPSFVETDRAAPQPARRR